MAFFASAVGVLQTLVIALGAGLGIWGVVNLMEGYGNDNPGAKSQGMKQLMAGGGVALIGTTLVPLLANLGNMTFCILFTTYSISVIIRGKVLRKVINIFGQLYGTVRFCFLPLCDNLLNMTFNLGNHLRSCSPDRV